MATPYCEAFAPPAVAGGDAPEIQVGDVVWHKDPDHGHDCMTWVRDAGHVRYVGDPAKTVIAIYRDPLWRRRQEGQ